MNDPEKIAAILAIRLLDARRKDNIWKAVFGRWPSRKRVEKLANSILEKDDLPIEPYITYVVEMIVRHFDESLTFETLPTEREITDWLSAKGGLPVLILEYVASLSRGGT
jgi:hypothetical protein